MFVKFIRVLIVVFWLIPSLYFGVGGYISIDLMDQKTKYLISPSDSLINVAIAGINMDFKNYEHFKYEVNYQSSKNYFPWIDDFSDTFSVLVTALSFGIIGGLTRLLKQICFDEDKSILTVKVLSIPLLGMLSGIIMLGFSYLLPTLIVSGDQSIRPTTLIFLTLFAGLFSRKFYAWLNRSFDKIFPPN